MARIGALLNQAMREMRRAGDEAAELVVAASFGNETEDARLPVLIKLLQLPPETGESWSDYRKRAEVPLLPLKEKIENLMNAPVELLAIANSLRADLTEQQIRFLSQDQEIQILELDPTVQATLMDDAANDVELDVYLPNHPGLDGQGVRVAVLDSGIDKQHPALAVDDSVSTCGESVDIPGEHGTHCAGSIASRDSVFRGIAPGVTLLNIKVLRANGTGNHTFVIKGIEEALDRQAHILSMSLVFNHLPVWSANGHGWTCEDGRCVLCTAVDNAVRIEKTLVVVAAGNEHERAMELRRWNYGHLFDTELGCPGQAREALTVGALNKNSFMPASFSSHGPTAYGATKPDIAAPGVNIMSTVPVPRDADGMLAPRPPRALLFRRLSGTSMATPIVAGAAALVIQSFVRQQLSWTPALVKQELLTNGSARLNLPPNVVGVGRLDLSRL